MAGAIPTVEPSQSHSVFKRALTAVALTRAGTRFSSEVGAKVDPWLFRVTRGRVHSALGQIPVLLLTAKGARSGRERTVPLLYFTDGQDVILIASSYGRAKLPAWYHNVKANPTVLLRAGGASQTYVAKEAEGEDRDRLFALAKLVYSGYADYERRTAGIRRIPVMRLSPA